MSRRVTLVSAGTRGDVQPLVALALRLKARGHVVRVAVNPDFVAWVTSLGLMAASTEDDSARRVQTAVEGRTTRLPWPLGPLRERLRPQTGLDVRLDRVRAICADGDLVVCSEASSLALHVADALRLPCVHVRFFPAWPTRAFPTPVSPLRTMGGLLNLASHHAFNALNGLSGAALVNAWRDRQGLRPWSFSRHHAEVVRRGWPLLFAMSDVLVPRAPDWPERARVTGFWFLDQPPALLPIEVDRFLQGGPAILVTMSSNAGSRARRVVQIVLDALSNLPLRALMTTTGADEPGAPVMTPSNVLITGPLSHADLLPRVSGLLHPAGAGTTAQALRAAVPSVTIPFHGEQRFWARRLAERGLGTAPLDWRRASAADVAAAVERSTERAWDRGPLRRAQARVLAEPGVDVAVAEIERLLERS